MRQINRKDNRRRRHLRIRRRINGTAERPRMAIHVSNRNIFVQFIDDDAARTLASADTQRDGGASSNRAVARLLGERAAKAAQEKGIKHVVVDRGGFLFHGRVRDVVEVALANGLMVSATPDGESDRKETVAT